MGLCGCKARRSLPVTVFFEATYSGILYQKEVHLFVVAFNSDFAEICYPQCECVSI